MSLSLKTHEYTETNGVPVLTRVTPYIRVSERGQAPLYLQGGHVYPEGVGEKAIPLEKYPPWLITAIESLTPEGRAEVGFSDWVPIPNDSTVPAGTEVKTPRKV